MVLSTRKSLLHPRVVIRGTRTRACGPLSALAPKQRSASLHGLPPTIFIADTQEDLAILRAIDSLPPRAMLLYRDYESKDRAGRADWLAGLCRERRLVFSVAGDAALAHSVRADGLHLSEWQSKYAARHGGGHRSRFACLTVAAHSVQGINWAKKAGADAILLAPAFPTASHPGARALGPHRFAALRGWSPLPVYALGGITPATLRRLPPKSTIGIAAISGFNQNR